MVTYSLSNTIARKRERYIMLQFIKRSLFSIRDISTYKLLSRYSTALKDVLY